MVVGSSVIVDVLQLQLHHMNHRLSNVRKTIYVIDIIPFYNVWASELTDGLNLDCTALRVTCPVIKLRALADLAKHIRGFADTRYCAG